MNSRITVLALAIALGLASAGNSFAQGGGASTPQAPANEKKEEPKKDPKTEEYEKAVKDLKRLEGNFTLYQRKKEILLELPESKLGDLFLLQAAFNTGVMGDGIAAGFPADGFGNVQAYKFERNEDSVLLVRPNIAYRWTNDDPFAAASERSFPHAILGSFRIENTNPEKKLLLVNVTNLFYGDVFRLGEMIASALGGPYQLERDKSAPEFVKSFSDNAVVRMKLHYFTPRPGSDNPLAALMGMSNNLEDGRSAPLKVTYNFWWRKDTGYMPRVYDARVGYFTTDFFNVGRFYQNDRIERYINRWNLKKKDPNAALSEPVKPIVWVIDNSIPVQYREATKRGILFWNKAFEKVGFKNAVQVIDQPKDPDYDHADGRYNVVRWTMSEDAGYAIALFRTDPFTGEILSASVNFDANMASVSNSEYDEFAVPAVNTTAMVDRSFAVLTNKFERDHAQKGWTAADAFIFEGERERNTNRFAELASKFGWKWQSCSYQHDKTESASLGWQGLEAVSMGRPKVSQAAYVNDFITDVTSHEVGHCMGLRHNFISSTRNSVADLANDNLLRQRSITTSVMEYTPTNTVALLRGTGVFFAPTVGEYDLWAIKYGYMPIAGASTPAGERHELSKVTALSGLPQHRFMSDENADSWDPMVARFDLARDPINYAQKNIELSNRMIKYALTELPKPGQSYARRTEILQRSMVWMFRQGRLTARFVGGMKGNKNFRGDSGEQATLQPISAADQRAASQMIASKLLSANAFNLPVSARMNMTQDHANGADSSWTAPLRALISSNQTGLVASMLSSSTINRIAENAYKWGNTPGAYTMDEHYAIISGAVFSEVGKSASIDPLRRDLQRFTVNALIIQAGAPANSVHEDARMLASDTLRRLSVRYGNAAKAKGANGMTAVYLRETKANIDRFLSRNSVGN
jgi:hypothetical protein